MEGQTFLRGGSSPRMRGKPRVLMEAVSDAGLIPAYAGKTSGTGNCVNQGGAHPRVCGENAFLVCLRYNVLGSSPRMRGKPNNPGAWRYPTGLIPAYAGKTLNDLEF